jgi:hemerythrin-like domain-containing protein
VHLDDKQESALLRAGLRQIAAGKEASNPGAFVRAATTFAEALRRHLAWEEERLFPIARKRLSRQDLEAIGRAMAARRGIAYPET